MSRPRPIGERGSVDEVVFRSPLVQIGLFRRHVSAPDFEDTGPTSGHLLVFPRLAVRIRHAGREPVVATPNVLMLYNRGQVYRREPVDAWGDASDWFAYDPSVLLAALSELDGCVEDRPHAPFVRTHAPSDPRVYARQRRIVHALAARDDVESLAVEEACLALLRGALQGASACSGDAGAGRASTRRARARLAQAATERLARGFRERWTLGELAREVHSSPYHLARVFRASTGASVQAFLDQLRLRSALSEIPTSEDLSDLALSLGYSSHSHFTSAFRRAFGTTPSGFRRLARGRRRELTEQLERDTPGNRARS